MIHELCQYVAKFYLASLCQKKKKKPKMKLGFRKKNLEE